MEFMKNISRAPSGCRLSLKEQAAIMFSVDFQNINYDTADWCRECNMKCGARLAENDGVPPARRM